MKKSLLLTLVFVAACGYVMAEDIETPVTQEEATQVPEQQQDDTLDMDELLADETEEVK